MLHTQINLIHRKLLHDCQTQIKTLFLNVDIFLLFNNVKLKNLFHAPICKLLDKRN
jgi:hypothetical protein